MPNLYVVDTHTLLWFLDNYKKLGAAAAKVLADPNAILILPAIALMHDRQIVATALLAQTNGNQVAILTRDESIRKCGLIQTMW